MKTGDIVPLWIDWMRCGGAPETTVGLRVYYIDRLSEAHPDLLALGTEDLTAWIAGHTWKPNTRKTVRSALRSFYGWALITGRIRTSPAALLPAVRIPRGVPKPTPEDGYRLALASADARVTLAVRLAGQCGLRRAEVARSRREDVIGDLVGWSLHVVGKGGHERVVPLPSDLAALILGMPPGWLFPSRASSGHLTPHYVARMVARCLPTGSGMHSLRHRCATTAYAATHDLRAVQELLGHLRPETTAGYVRTPDEAIRAAVEAAAA